ncbi:MAG: ATP-binding cassette domain-containing protein [Saprospiraceae bacterium]|nr:ATP-binding cassette domain-containing protein [Saprospiraceae bacterium]
MKILAVQSLSKSFGQIQAVQSLDLEVHSGQVWGILGPNGSGKTTFLGMLLGIIRPDSGHFQWFEDQKGPEVRKYLGALLETPNFYPYLNADDNLSIIRQIKGSNEDNFDAILELVGLKERRLSKFAGYSLGMRQRLAIGAAMIGDPEVLILDEPTNGLDPEGIADVRSTLLEIAHNGKTIIMASHILDEVEKVCSHVAILRKGKLLAKGPVGSILSGEITLQLQAEDMNQLGKVLQRLFPQFNPLIKDARYEIQVAPSFSSAQLNKMLMAEGVALSQLVVKKHSLESEFLDIIKKQ